MPPRSELEEKVRDFAIDEGILGRKLPKNPKLEFAYEVKFPPKSPKPMKIMVLKPNDSKAISIQAPTQISKQHQDALKKQGSNTLLQFFLLLKKYVLSHNLLYNIDAQNGRYVILENIFPDGLTEDAFYRGIRKVFNAGVFMNLTLNELIAGGSRGKIKDISDTDFSTGHSMFT